MTLKDTILGSDDVLRREVSVPEWDCTIWMHGVSAEEREKWESSLKVVDGTPQVFGARCRFLVKCIHDKEGHRVFSDSDSESLSRKSSIVIDRLWEIANDLNTLTESAAEAVMGNLDGDHSDGSCSA